jgi:zinc D-Ala-D-Ala carboxypeptidase
MTIPGYPTDTHYSPNFTRAELDCHCGCETTPDEAMRLAVLAEHLEQYRHVGAGYPLHINDAKRCPAENARVGGVAHSQHLECRAADVSSDHHAPGQLAMLAAEVPAFEAGGIGTYPTFAHVDYRPNGPARWTGT